MLCTQIKLFFFSKCNKTACFLLPNFFRYIGIPWSKWRLCMLCTSDRPLNEYVEGLFCPPALDVYR